MADRTGSVVKHSEDMQRNQRYDGRGRQNASALLLALFTILLVSSLVVSVIAFLKSSVDEYSAFNHQFRARQLAQSGLAFGLNPQTDNVDQGLLNQRLADGGQFQVTITSESTRLNVNFLLQNERDDILETLFRKWGVATNAANAAVQGLRNWVTAGQQIPEQGSNQAQEMEQLQQGQLQQGQLPTNAQNGGQGPQKPALQLVRPFRSVEEMSLVSEFAPVAAAEPDWAKYFTVWSDGTINVNAADADVIAMVTGVTPEQAKHFVQHRWGPDGIPYTADDTPYTTVDQVRTELGMTPQQFQLVQGLLSINSSVDRVVSKGIINGYTDTLTVIARRNSVPIAYLVWQED
jgi:general secretion pathway protein K